MEQIMITNMNKQELVDIIENTVLKVIRSSPQRESNTTEKPIGVSRAAEILMLSVPSIYRKVNNLEIPHFKKGNRLYFYESKLLSYVEGGKQFTHDEIGQISDLYIKK